MRSPHSTDILSTTRVEAFSDAVIAILMTIMVLELKSPHEVSVSALAPLAPVFLSYVLSFLLVTIMWVGHHYLLHLAQRVNRPLLWANNHLLFWMSLIPFVTSSLGEHPTAPFAVALYAVVLGAGIGSFGLLRHIVSQQQLDDPEQMAFHAAVQRQNWVSAVLYVLAAPLAYVSVYLSYAILVTIPLFYLTPGRWFSKRY